MKTIYVLLAVILLLNVISIIGNRIEIELRKENIKSIKQCLDRYERSERLNTAVQHTYGFREGIGGKINYTEDEIAEQHHEERMQKLRLHIDSLLNELK